MADYRPERSDSDKIKKLGGELTTKLERNPDIILELGKKKGSRLLVGFAAETEDLTGNARSKLAEKNLDMVVTGDVTRKGAGFACDTKIVKIISRDGKVESLPILSKRRVAAKVLANIVDILNEKDWRV